MAALACVACCALPALITAGVVGAGASALVGWLPALAAALGTSAGGTWWLHYHYRHRRQGKSGCSRRARSAGSGCECARRPTAAAGPSDSFQ